ncbi:hypothetical protein G6M26_41685 [Agrobacterium tumefaciens]|nr:hypothetical protein [Agrobacterium tumefaciens]NTE25060.1 hypothetical protein [Agrobacterium tumefaciens]
MLKWDKFVANFYLVNIYYIAFRLAFNLITQRGPLLNWTKQIIYWFSIIILSYIVYGNIIQFKKNLLPDFTTIANELWIIILVFVFHLVNGVKLSNEGMLKRKDAYLKSKYSFFKKKYGRLISNNTKNTSLEIIAYAILIYEDFNRPRIARWYEYLTFFMRKKQSLGVMQFPTTKWINDNKSVDLGTKKLYTSYKKILEEKDSDLYQYESEVRNKIVSEYNGGTKYNNEISILVDSIGGLFYEDNGEYLLPAAG